MEYWETRDCKVVYLQATFSISNLWFLDLIQILYSDTCKAKQNKTNKQKKHNVLKNTCQ